MASGDYPYGPILRVSEVSRGCGRGNVSLARSGMFRQFGSVNLALEREIDGCPGQDRTLTPVGVDRSLESYLDPNLSKKITDVSILKKISNAGIKSPPAISPPEDSHAIMADFSNGDEVEFRGNLVVNSVGSQKSWASQRLLMRN